MSFEIILGGSFAADDAQLLKDVQNRLSLHADSSVILHQEHYEFVLDSPLSPPTSLPRPDGSSLRAKRDLVAKATHTGHEWTLHTSLKSIRSFTKTLVRPCVVIPLATGDVITFASALGYRLKEITTRKGWLFTLGPTTTLALYQVLPPGPPPGGPSHPPSLWHVEVISLVMQAQPKNVSLPPTDYLQESSQQVLAIAVLMKGLVDLVPPGR